MLNSSIPPKFQIPWANSASAANVRSIPVASQLSIQAGAASLTDGFPPLNFVPVSAGGVPPFGQDMNGILRQTTQWLQWVAAGGAVRYDATFVAAVGGYPAGAQITSNSGHAVFESLVDNNSSDPNAGLGGGGGAVNWRILSCVWSGSAWAAVGSANIQLVTLSPAPTSLAQLTGVRLTIISQGTNSGPAFLNVNGLGNIPVVTTGGIQLANSALVTSYPFDVVLIGTSAFVLMTRTNTFLDSGVNGLIIQGSGTSGANLILQGNGNTTPNKYIRAIGGSLQVVNSAYSNTILTLDDTGRLSTTGDISTSAGMSAGGQITSGGNITAVNSRLRATFGSTGSGDQNAAPILADFASAVVSTQNGWATIPSFGLGGTNNFIIQWGVVGVPGGPASTIFGLPRAFPVNFASIVISYGASVPPEPPNVGVVGAEPATLSTFKATNTVASPQSNGCFFIAIGW